MLNNENSIGWNTDIAPFVVDDNSVLELKRILTETGATIVLSSTWRLSERGVKILREKIQPFEIKHTTPIHWSPRGRRWEILDWMATKIGFNGFLQKLDLKRLNFKWAVVDDDVDADLEDGSFFRTNFFAGGLTKEIADSIIQHLNK